ncbi:MAG: MFS transporter [Verrucomicrobiales bacterium]|nr:MFS transporter [Verrucomicrobiales bacterium]
MSTTTNNEEGNKVLFWGCFIALVTTAFSFISRMFLLGTWGEEFGLDDAQAGRLAGIGIWPFAVSIIGFSLVIDRIGYKVAMIFAFISHIVWAAMAVSAYFISQQGNTQLAFELIYWGSLVCALGNGTVEAFINPVVATMYNKEKTKWLNILHAGWPGGLVLAGMIIIFIDHVPWWVKVGLIAIPAVVYFMMLIKCKFPVNERVASGVSYRDMLGEFGVLGAAIVGFLVTLQLIDFAGQGGSDVSSGQKNLFIAIGVAIAVAFGVYTKSLGRPLLFILVLIHMPLAVTEIGTDGWIENILKGIAEGKFHPGWVLVYTSLIMMVLRFYAGPIVHKLQPLKLLAVSSVLAIIGLYTLSITAGMAIFVAATIYGLGKTFFWPTMLGVVSEQCPRGGALALNAIAGIGMLAVGTLGFPYIGALKEAKAIESVQANTAIVEKAPALVKDGQFQAQDEKAIYEIIKYNAFSDGKVDELIKDKTDEEKKEIKEAIKKEKDSSGQKALADMTVFPVIMLVFYVGLIFHFNAKGGYKPMVLGADGGSSEVGDGDASDAGEEEKEPEKDV